MSLSAHTMPIKFTGKGGGVGIEVLNGSLAVGRREGVFDDFSCGDGGKRFWMVLLEWNGRGIINVQFESSRRAIQTWAIKPPPPPPPTHTHTHNHLHILACSKFLISQAIALVLSPGS